MVIQWYPGHMTKAKRNMQEGMRLVDAVIELLDARAPLSSRNPDIDELSKGKARVVLLNKADLADEQITAKWIEYFKSKDILALKLDSRKKSSMKAVEERVILSCKEKIERDKRRGIKFRPIKAMVCGIPNVGKSTFINTYAKRSALKTGNRPGVTKAVQWVRLGENIELLDTPGILWPKFDDEKVGQNLAFIGSIRDEIVSIEDLAIELIKTLDLCYNNIVSDFFGINSPSGELFGVEFEGQTVTDKGAITLIEIAKAKNCLKAGGTLDLFKASNLLFEAFRNGKMGRVSLEQP